MSNRSKLSMSETASMFGAALALRSESPTLVAFANNGKEVKVPKAGSILKLAQLTAGANSGGTQTIDVLAKVYAGHDRVIILTDEQAFAANGTYTGYFGGTTWDGIKSVDVKDVIGHIKCPIYTWNLAGYRAAHLPSGGNRFTFGGLTDAGFTALGLLESHQDDSWPF